MEIIVCIKQVPETTEVKINPETNTLIREGVASIINPFDMYAIEEGLRIKERYSGKVTVITMGPLQAESSLKEAISLGIDETILLSDRKFAGADTLATSYTLATAISKISNFDIIICGKQATDGDTAQVGPGIAQKLNIPYVTYVKKIEEIKQDYIKVERMMEEGYEIIETSLPALITVVKEINEPRLPSLKGKIKAKNAKISNWNTENMNFDCNKIGLTGSPTSVIKIFTPPRKTNSEILSGDISLQAEILAKKIKEMKII